MRRSFQWDKKYLHGGVTAFCVVAAAILFYMTLNELPALGAALKALLGILSPFIWGLVITYLLSPLMLAMERRLFLPVGRKLYPKRKKKAARFARGFSVLASELILLTLIAALFYLILPQIYSSIDTIVSNSGEYIARLSQWASGLIAKYPDLGQYLSGVLSDTTRSMSDIVAWVQGNVLPRLGSVLTNLTSGLYYVMMGVYNLIIGVIVSVYVMSNMEGFGAAARRLLYCIFPVETAEKIRDATAFIDKTFMGFIKGKILDSAIIGLICYIACSLLKMPYTLLVSVIVGVTNVIPFFGPFIGAVPCAFIILLVNPVKCLIFIAFIVVLQQVDGNIIGPKILGNSVGINGFWVMFSIILGAGLFGFWGMLLGVPVFVVIYTAVNTHVEKKLKRSGLPWEMEDYMDIDHIDPVTRRAVKKEPPPETNPDRLPK